MGRLGLWTAVLLGLGTTTWAAGADAQYRLDRFRAAERADDGFGVRRLGAVGHLQLGANATFDYANDPLTASMVASKGKTAVEHELVLKLDVSLALWSRAIFFAGFDAPLAMSGQALPAGARTAEADGSGFGDLSLGGRVLVWGDADDLFALGAQAAVILPTAGDAQAYSGEESLALRPELIAELRPEHVRVTGNLGTVLKGSGGGKAELVFGAAVGVPVHERVEILGELNGGVFDPLPLEGTLGLEGLVGAKYRDPSGLYAGLGAGSAFSEVIGSPDVRVVAQIGGLGPLHRKVKPVDPDGDGLIGADDKCPNEAEDKDGFADDDGCADTDNDGDGVLDAVDACQGEGEDRDGDRDQDGCPEADLDSDQDGISDHQDECPLDAEDKDAFRDEDGCPDGDNDEDGIADEDDVCRNEPGILEEKGCKAKVIITERGELEITEQILFETDKAVILPKSDGVLDSVRRTLAKHPEIERLRIEGHTDAQGAARRNKQLSAERARAVATWLVERDIEAGRLIACGCGSAHPIADEATDEGRANNRRVAFQIVVPKPSDATREKTPAGCMTLPVPKKKPVKTAPEPKPAATNTP